MAVQEQIKYQNIKNQITLEVELKKIQRHWNRIFFCLFNSTTKRVINHEFALEKSFQEIL